MAKQKKFESVADSIFDFIFASAKKNVRSPEKLSPSGATGNEMADALAEIALRPVMYAGDQVLTPLEETLDNYSFSSNKVKLDKGSDLKIGIRGTDFANFLTDPESFIEKSFQKIEGGKESAKTLNRIRGLGGFMDLGIGAMLAKSRGLSTKEALRMGWELGNERMKPEVRDLEVEKKTARASTNAALADLNYNRPVNNRFGSNNVDELSNAFFNALDSTRFERDDIAKITAGVTLDEVNENKDNEFKRIINTRLNELGHNQNNVNEAIADKYLGLVKKHSKDAKDYGSKGHGEFWNLGNDLSVDTELTWKQTKKMKEKEEQEIFGPDSQGFYSGEKWSKSRYATNKFRSVLGEELAGGIAFLETEREMLIHQGRSTDEIDEKQKKLEEKFKILALWQRSDASNMKYNKLFGEVYLHGQAFNQMITQGGGLTAILDGSFFDANRNYWSPSKDKRDVKIKAFSEDQSLGDIKVAKDENIRYYSSFTGVYYLTPGSIVRTLLVNGEGFVYLGYLKERSIQKSLSESNELFDFTRGNAVFDGVLSGVDRNDSTEVLGKLSNDYVRTLDILESNSISITDPRLLRMFERLDKMKKKLQNSVALRYASALNRLWVRINKFSPTKIIEGAVTKSLMVLMGKKAAKKLMSGGTAITLKVAIRSMVAKAVGKLSLHAIGQSLGLALGGIANGLIFVATEVIYWLATKLLKPVIKIVMFFVWGFILLIIVVVVWGSFGLGEMLAGPSHIKKFDTAVGAAPIYCEECEGYWDPVTGTGSGTVGVWEDPGNYDLPEDYEGICPLGPGSLHCSQGPGGGFSHVGRNAIDISWNGSGEPKPRYWVAPKDGTVTQNQMVYWSGSQKCGGIVTFKTEDTTYRLVHVVPRASLGPLSQGEVVAELAFEHHGNVNFRSSRPTCSTGAHWHLDVFDNSAPADQWYRGPLECNLGACSY